VGGDRRGVRDTSGGIWFGVPRAACPPVRSLGWAHGAHTLAGKLPVPPARFRRPFQGLPFVSALPTQGSLRIALGYIPSSAPRTFDRVGPPEVSCTLGGAPAAG